tara:strand:+ start:156 stop:650 length:495 start_codon:yes stop_codon:yes gene_type:complete
MATVIRGSDNFDTAYAKSVAIIADVKAVSTVAGGSSTGWQTRDLNTEIDDPLNIVSITSNQFTLQAGTYLIEWSCPALGANHHTSRLYNVTTSAVSEQGTAAYMVNSSNVQTTTTGASIQTISSATVFRIEHHFETAKASNGLGTFSDSGNSVYTLVKIHKIGA